MANHTSLQLTEDFRKYPIDDHGKLRTQFFTIPALTVAYAANDTVDLFLLPPGRKRLLPNLSRLSGSAFGAGRTIDIGHRAYNARPSAAADAEVEDPDALIDGLDVSAATNAVAWSTALKFDMYSVDEVMVFATILGGTMPVGATLSGFLTYLYE